jgi:hypothetical protein
MTRQEMNEVILRHIDADIREQPNVAQKVSKMFQTWFQTLVQAASMPSVEEQPPEEAEGAPA